MNRQLVLTLLLVCGQAWAQGAVAAHIEHKDPWVWIIGGFGAAIVYVKNHPASKSDAVVNSMISVMIGGLVSPYVATYLGSHYDKSLQNPYPLAFLLSAFWPWIVPMVAKRIRLVITGREEKEDHDSEVFDRMNAAKDQP